MKTKHNRMNSIFIWLNQRKYMHYKNYDAELKLLIEEKDVEIERILRENKQNEIKENIDLLLKLINKYDMSFDGAYEFLKLSDDEKRNYRFIINSYTPHNNHRSVT